MSKPVIRDEFPNDFFPPVLEEFRMSAARSIGTSDEYMVGPMLAAASVAIGTAMTAVLKTGWHEPPSLFLATVGYKSSGKTPAAQHALKPLEDQQREREREFAGEGPPTAYPCTDSREDEGCCGLETTCCGTGPVHDDDDDVEDDDDDEYGNGNDDDEEEMCCGGGGDAATTSTPLIATPVLQPRPESLQHLIITDTTHAALWDVLSTSQRGVLVAVDELSTVFLQSTSSQRQTWCEIFQAGSRTVHRKTHRHGPIILPRTFVTLCGGIQPDLFPSIRGKHDGGLLERFLISGKPETSLPPWTNEVVDSTSGMAWNLAIVALLDVEKAQYTGSAERKGLVHFTKAAYDRLGRLHNSLEEYLQFRGVHIKHHGIVRKLVANAARLALIRRLLRWATGEFGFFGPVGSVEEADCDAACRAAEFFLSRYLLWVPNVLPRAEEPLITAMAAPTATSVPSGLADRLLAYIKAKGRPQVEVRWLRQQTLDGNPSTDQIRAALDEAVSRGQGSWKDGEKKTFIVG